MIRWTASVLLVTVMGVCLGSPPVDIPSEVKGDVGSFITVTGKTEGVTVRFVALDPGLSVFPPNLLTDKKSTVVVAAKSGRYRLLAYSSIKDDPTEPFVVTVVVGDPPPVVPVNPIVPPDIKPNEPLKSLRVFLITDNATPLTDDQKAVIYGKDVEAWLNANCTGGKDGWRRRTKIAPGENDPTMAALWAAIQPTITVTPCIAIERNSKVEIVNPESTPAKMIAVLQSYKGGK